jgi:hypothetical protein
MQFIAWCQIWRGKLSEVTCAIRPQRQEELASYVEWTFGTSLGDVYGHLI